MNRGIRLSLCAAVLIVGVVQVSVAFSRSLIPHEINGTLQRVGVVGDSDQRIFTATIDGRIYVVDNPSITEIRLGRHVSKDAWSMTLLLDERKPVRLGLGDEVLQFTALTLLALAATWILSAPRQSGPGCLGAGK